MPARKLIAIAENLRRLEAALKAGFWTFDMRSKVLEWSQGYYDLLGLKPEAVLPDIAVGAGLIHPADQQDWAEILTLARKSRQTVRTIRIIRPDGNMIRVRSHYEGHFDRSGNLVTLYGTMIDVSEQEIEREQAEKGRTFAQSIRTLSDGVVWRAGPDGRLIDMSEWFRMTGETPEQAKDWDALTGIHPEDRARFRATWQAGVSSKTPVSYQARVRQRSGEYINYVNRALPIMDDDGAIVEWHGYSFPVAGRIAADASQETQRLTSAQIRAARALVDWSGPDLAERSGVSFSTIKRMEKSEDLVKRDSVKRVRSTLEDAGIRFASGADGEVSVTLAPMK